MTLAKSASTQTKPENGTEVDDDLGAALAWLEDCTYVVCLRYCYLGEDSEGKHHHLNEDENTVYVTDRPHETFVPAGKSLNRYRLVGKLEHVENLDAHDEKDLETWVKFIRSTRGWENEALTYVSFNSELVDCLD
ncbi:hypothetical protein [Natrinema soli]|uniref:Uncharacterized protein n=1 Tax=Natrinema soli TaxID=1930624 RepID=A0ABD5SJV0_9EURY|nr:hypothetical protein [Natrinema soli]